MGKRWCYSVATISQPNDRDSLISPVMTVRHQIQMPCGEHEYQLSLRNHHQSLTTTTNQPMLNVGWLFDYRSEERNFSCHFLFTAVLKKIIWVATDMTLWFCILAYSFFSKIQLMKNVWWVCVVVMYKLAILQVMTQEKNHTESVSLSRMMWCTKTVNDFNTGLHSIFLSSYKKIIFRLSLLLYIVDIIFLALALLSSCWQLNHYNSYVALMTSSFEVHNYRQEKTV